MTSLLGQCAGAQKTFVSARVAYCFNAYLYTGQLVLGIKAFQHWEERLPTTGNNLFLPLEVLHSRTGRN